MSNGNYPAGAANDSSAPWNQKEDEVCPHCDGQDEDCIECNGTGFISADEAEEYYEDKEADDRYDRERDER